MKKIISLLILLSILVSNVYAFSASVSWLKPSSLTKEICVSRVLDKDITYSVKVTQETPAKGLLSIIRLGNIVKIIDKLYNECRNLHSLVINA